MNKKDLIKLNVNQEGQCYSIFLDDKELHHVEKYKIDQGVLPGTAKLYLEILVQFP